MFQSHVVATCCYCGTRAALNLAVAGARHELACSNCGAPLSQLKNLRTDAAPAPTAPKRIAPAPEHDRPRHKKREPRRENRRGGLRRRLFDLAEEALDEIFD